MFSKKQEFLLSAFASYIRQTTIATKRAVLQAYEDYPEIAEKFLRYFDLNIIRLWPQKKPMSNWKKKLTRNCRKIRR